MPVDLYQVFSKNLRQRRHELGLTEKKLADLLGYGYTEKAISKWENGGNLPPSAVLPQLALLLKTSIDSLMSEPAGIQYYLGIDGGGTKTEFLLENVRDHTVRRIIGEGCNPNAVGIETTKQILKSGIYQVCEGISMNLVVAFAGIAGCKSGNYTDEIRNLFEGLHFADYRIGSDNESIIAAGLGGQEGISVILGTGICAYAVTKHAQHKIAGWGYLFDNGGSSFHIGRDAIACYYSAYDGSGPKTSLTGRIEEISDCPSEELLKRLYSGGNKLVASYAVPVFEEAEKGDAVAESILEKNFAEIARIIRAALKYFPDRSEPIPVIFAGGLTKRPTLMTLLKKALGEDAERCDLRILQVDPVVGSIQLAKEIWESQSNNGED